MKSLMLNSYSISAAFVEALALGLRDNRNFEELRLSIKEVPVADKRIERIAEGLRHSKSLKILELSISATHYRKLRNKCLADETIC